MALAQGRARIVADLLLACALQGPRLGSSLGGGSGGVSRRAGRAPQQCVGAAATGSWGRRAAAGAEAGREPTREMRCGCGGRARGRGGLPRPPGVG